MGHLDTIEKAAQKLIALCQKEKQTKTDKEKMLVIHAEILTSIENLTECELCGAITEMIVTMTLADVTAKLCKECGVKSLEVGKIQASKQGASRKRTQQTKTRTSSSAEPKSKSRRASSKREAPVEEPESPAALHTRIEAQTGIKKADVKRLHKIVQDIAAPMSAEHTLTYVQREVEIAKIKIEADALKKAVTLLT
jgi:Na+-transporting NADH:ubiquinone oxidoreductase subunit NqrC